MGLSYNFLNKIFKITVFINFAKKLLGFYR